MDSHGRQQRLASRATPQTSIAEWHYAFSGILTFAGLMYTRDDTHLTGKSCRAAEAGRVPRLGNYCGGREGADTWDRCE
jgi:hypothetical protein